MNMKVYDPKVYTAANPKNKALLEDYLVELKAKRRKPSTLTQYRSDGRMLVCYVKEQLGDMYFLDFKRKELRQLSLWLTEERQVSNARFNRVFALIHGMAEYAEDEDEYDYEKNYARKIKNLPNEPVKPIIFLKDEQITKLREYLLAHKMFRECAYLDISYDSAARIGEIVQMKKDDILSTRYSNKVTGKRGKRYNIVYHDRSIESLGLYLKQRGEDNLDELWVTTRFKTPKPITEAALYDLTKHMSRILSKLEGRKIDFSPHSFRHSALENYENGTHYFCKVVAEPKRFSLEELQVLAHHDNIDTTKSYLKPKENTVLENMFDIQIKG